MFGDMEGLEEIENPEAVRGGCIAMYVEHRGYDWEIFYYVFSDRVEVVESMDGNYEHCKETVKTLEEAIAIASKWS